MLTNRLCRVCSVSTQTFNISYRMARKLDIPFFFLLLSIIAIWTGGTLTGRLCVIWRCQIALTDLLQIWRTFFFNFDHTILSFGLLLTLEPKIMHFGIHCCLCVAYNMLNFCLFALFWKLWKKKKHDKVQRQYYTLLQIFIEPPRPPIIYS